MKKTTIPLLDLPKLHKPLRGDIARALLRVLDGGAYILGPDVEKFEREAAAYCGAGHAIGVSSGTDALLLALMSLGIGPGDEVATTPYTFFATAGSVSRLGARPVFVDIDPRTYNLDASRLAQVVGKKTKAVIAVHLFGRCADLDAVSRAAPGVPVIEDAAQAIGARDGRGRAAGSMGVFGCFSFFPSKNLGALGDGGLLTTNDAALAERARVLRVHGMKPKYVHHFVGGNFRLDAIQAAVLSVKLKRLDRWAERRRKNAALYRRRFEADGLTAGGFVSPPEDAPGHVFNQFIIRAQRRDALKDFLSDHGIASEIYYPAPLHLQACFNALGYRAGDFPESERASAETLALPVGPELDSKDLLRVAGAVKRFYKG